MTARVVKTEVVFGNRLSSSEREPLVQGTGVGQ